jgi:hypothetical protein
VTKCLFCAKPGATREHVLSLAWLTRVMPSTGAYKFDRMAEDQGRVNRQRYERRKPEVVRRAVCSTCNNGWMNELDQGTQPVVTAMIMGNRVAIADVVNKTSVAAWICKVSLLVDSMQEVEGALASSHAHYLYAQRVPPPGWRIWLAALDRFDEHHVTLGAFTLVRPQGRGYLGTIGINHLVAQVMVLPAEEADGTHPMPKHVVPLWPPTAEPTTWPPLEALHDDNALEQFGRIVAGVPMKMESPPPQVPLDLHRSGHGPLNK